MSIVKSQIEAVHALLLPPNSIGSEEECLAAVDRLGFAWAFTPGDRSIPSIFPAMAAKNDHQRWDWMWGWKDRLSASRRAYYGKAVATKPTLVSLEWLPRLYALTGNSGDLEDDLLHVAETVRLSEMARKVCQYVRENGPTGTRTLIAQLTDGTRPMKAALEKGIEQLDRAMMIAKCGTEGGNSIANVWDLFPRLFPDAVEAGAEIPTREAAVLLLRHAFVLTPAAARRALERLFPWNQGHQGRALARMLDGGELVECSVDGRPGLRRSDFTS